MLKPVIKYDQLWIHHVNQFLNTPLPVGVHGYHCIRKLPPHLQRLISNVSVGGATLAEHTIALLHPFGVLVGLSGIILVAYVIAIPANEIVIPTILMLIVLVAGLSGFGEGAGVMFELDSEADTAALLKAGGWNLLMAVNLMLFSLVHNPCSTTIYTIWKETGSKRWTTISALLPVVMGLALCFVVAQVWRFVEGLIT